MSDYVYSDLKTDLKTDLNQELFLQANNSLVGGVNSPVRSFKAVGGNPVFIKRAKGAYLYDANGKKYIDYVNSWGANLLGHGDARIVSAITQQAGLGLSFGAPCELETRCADLIKKLVPSVDKLMPSVEIEKYEGENK